MFKELRFDVVGAVKRAEKYDGEWEALHQFASSSHKNVVFDYDTARDAINAKQWIAKTVKKENIPVKVHTFRNTSVLIVKKEGK